MKIVDVALILGVVSELSEIESVFVDLLLVVDQIETLSSEATPSIFCSLIYGGLIYPNQDSYHHKNVKRIFRSILVNNAGVRSHPGLLL